MTDECWRCGRATRQWWGNRYAFGPVCDRADCRRVKAAFSERFRLWNMSVSLPVEGMDGKPSCWTPDGEARRC